MLSWLATYFVTYVIVLFALLVLVKILSRWAVLRGDADRYLSPRWVREFRGE